MPETNFEPNPLRSEFVRKSVSADSLVALDYAASVNINFDRSHDFTLTLAGDVAFTASNLGSVKRSSVRIMADGSSRTLSFPSDWVFIGGAAPASIDANKTALLSVTCYGQNDSDVVAAYAAEL